jgi:hypothetical protein
MDLLMGKEHIIMTLDAWKVELTPGVERDAAALRGVIDRG